DRPSPFPLIHFPCVDLTRTDLRMPRNLKRKRVASTIGSSSSNMQNGSATTVATKNGLEVDFRKGELFDAAHPVDVVAFSVDERLHGPMRTQLAKLVGAAFFDETVAKATTAHKRTVMQGEMLPLDLSACTTFPVKYALMVVHPLACHLKMAYKGILQFAISKNLETVAIPGLGCGGAGVCPTVSSSKLHDVLNDWAGGFKGIPKRLNVVDLNMSTVDAFKDTFGMGCASSSSSSSSNSSKRGRGRAAAAAVGGAADASPDHIVRAVTAAPAEIEAIDCSVCMDSLRDGDEEVVQLTACGHQIHYQCFVDYLSNANRRCCWICGNYFWLPQGNMPHGTMTHSVLAGHSIEGHADGQGVICIEYSFRSGTQGPQHPRPGVPYSGTRRSAYLPNNEAGRKVLRLLEKAFECKLTFTVGDSVTSGARDTVVWNNVHHKTSMHGGPQAYGYPDPTYLERLTEELAALGITEALLG
ncbi:hypothetical protein PFISCL1PPCAC_23329, partial [Pristionchus fissidentatus]